MHDTEKAIQKRPAIHSLLHDTLGNQGAHARSEEALLKSMLVLFLHHVTRSHIKLGLAAAIIQHQVTQPLKLLPLFPSQEGARIDGTRQRKQVVLVGTGDHGDPIPDPDAYIEKPPEAEELIKMTAALIG